ncbi:glycosyltransferase family 2 protein [Colwellia echini]|uniref:Glycosyltransferase family 2 protein n=1 Tax=Colwellia echini TaxID=1982103 RepID=A0ABY3MU59_9GAMM|nr:glycosyltransferase family 2 protein [Colwellia echini]TYK64724.1 glycosyltransferase family 2 protein [Colwellia echini]
MTIFISVVSHLHGELIEQLGCLAKLAERFKVVVKVNSEETYLLSYLKLHNINVIDTSYGLGFGHNNNIIYNYCEDKLGMNSNDYFIVFNPDVYVESEALAELVNKMFENNCQLAGANLFKNKELTIPDNSIRHFPTFLQFFKSFLGLGNSTIIDKSKVLKPIEVDWASGSFLAFKASHYRLLGGFDQGYFMYCEDIDICFRSNKIGIPLTFYPDIKMLHLAKHANRALFSKHFYWHLCSVGRFLLTKVGVTKPKSIIGLA